MEPEFIHGTLAIDKDGIATDTMYCDDRKIKVTVILPRGVLGDFTSFEHQRIWSAYRALQQRIETVIKEKCSGLPTENCTFTLEKSDLMHH